MKVLSMEAGHYGRWIENLNDKELFVYTQGMIGSAISEHVCLDKEDVKEIGGLKELRRVLNSIEQKAESLNGYEYSYSTIKKVLKRVRNKFKITD
jgi:hypothetical protein